MVINIKVHNIYIYIWRVFFGNLIPFCHRCCRGIISAIWPYRETSGRYRRTCINKLQYKGLSIKSSGVQKQTSKFLNQFHTSFILNHARFIMIYVYIFITLYNDEGFKKQTSKFLPQMMFRNPATKIIVPAYRGLPAGTPSSGRLARRLFLYRSQQNFFCWFVSSSTHQRWFIWGGIIWS